MITHLGIYGPQYLRYQRKFDVFTIELMVFTTWSLWCHVSWGLGMFW